MIEHGDEKDFQLISELSDEIRIGKMVRQPLCSHPNHGQHLVQDLIHGHPLQCHFLLRMRPEVFLDLCDKIENQYKIITKHNVEIECCIIFVHLWPQCHTEKCHENVWTFTSSRCYGAYGNRYV